MVESVHASPLSRDTPVGLSAAASALNTDFCPWANRYVYWLKSPLGVLIAFFSVCLLAGCTVASEAFAVAGATALLIVLGIAWPAIAVRGLRASLHFPRHRGTEGEEVAVHLEIENVAPWPVWGIQLEGGFFLGDDQVAVALSCVRPCSKATFRWVFRPPVRGSYPRIRPQIAVGFPLGLWQARKQVSYNRELLVWPRRLPLNHLPLPAGDRRALYMASDSVIGHEGERVGPRAFRPGDSLRDVHWAQSARFDRLIVCERQGAAQTDVEIVPRLETLSTDGGVDAPSEWALRVLASMASAFQRQGVVSNVAWNGGTLSVNPDPNSLAQFMDTLAQWSPSAAKATPSTNTHRGANAPRFVIEGTPGISDASLKGEVTLFTQRLDLAIPAQSKVPCSAEQQADDASTSTSPPGKLRIRYFPRGIRGNARSCEEILLTSSPSSGEELSCGWLRVSREVWHAH